MSLKLVTEKPEETKKPTADEVIDFSKLKEQKANERRAEYERILFNKMLGVYSIVEGQGLKSIELLDVSLDGLSFQISADSPEIYQKGDEIKVRLYFSQETFIPVMVKIMNSKPISVQGRRMVRYGAQVDKDTKSYNALKTFAEFVKIYSEVCVKDDGTLPIFIF